ncbi:hypothetical protein [Spirillospora sp. NPDC047279]|uniref:hypothetical protein n=1 Tax=Spirillospora sp. NPDC047279 TaxID=3155478 RepID=UPI0033C77E21
MRLARAILYTVVPLEVIFLILLASGVRPPPTVLLITEFLVAAAFLFELAVAARLYLAARRTGATARAALRSVMHDLVPVRVRRIIGFDTKGLVSLALWVARRRHGVPDGATAVSYSRAETTTKMVFLFAMVVELFAVEILLRALGVPAPVRTVVLVLDAYSILIVLAVIAACVTRPHVITADEVRIRYGAFFDLRVPRAQIAGVRQVTDYNESKIFNVEDDRLGIAVASQTNIVLDLTEPITATRPLGGLTEATTVRFFADAPASALAALNSTPPRPVRTAREYAGDH